MQLRLSDRQWQRFHAGLAGEVTQRLAVRREKLIVDHLVMATRIARHLKHRFAPHLDERDLIQEARVGLIQAADRYRSEFGDFQPFAYLRIRGAVIDANKRRFYREQLHRSLDEMRQREATNGELRRAHIARVLADVDTDKAPLADEQADSARQLARLRAAIEELPEEERMVLTRSLAGELITDIAASRGHSRNWAGVRLRSAKAKVAARMHNRPWPS